MAWGPPGKTKHERRPVTKAELEAQLAKHEWDGLRDFVETIREGDELFYEYEGNNHISSSRYVGKRPSGMSYGIVVSVRMS